MGLADSCVFSPPGGSASPLFYFRGLKEEEDGTCFYARVKYFSVVFVSISDFLVIFLLHRKESLVVICGIREPSV